MKQKKKKEKSKKSKTKSKYRDSPCAARNSKHNERICDDDTIVTRSVYGLGKDQFDQLESTGISIRRLEPSKGGAGSVK